MKKEMKVSLTLLKRYVAEAEKALDDAYNQPEDTTEDNYKFIMNLSKVVGLIAGISQEAGLLVGDLQKVVQYNNPLLKEEGGLESLKSALSQVFPKSRKDN